MDKDKIDIDSLNPVDYNPRKIGKKALERLTASIREHTGALKDWNKNDGYRLASTITVNESGSRVIGGHQRLEALKSLGQSWVHRQDITWVNIEPNSAREKALCVSLNNDQSSGRWDQEKLNDVISELQEDVEDLFDSLDFSVLQKELDDSAESDEAEKQLAELNKQKELFRDNLEFVVQEILDKYGDTVPFGFVFFNYKNRLHLMVQCDKECYESVKIMAEGLSRENRVINEFLVNTLAKGFADETWDDLVLRSETTGYVPVSPSDLTEDPLSGVN